ncbi:hypothetical protein GCK32_016298, partial [Trichostrongylus colubriformis]
ILPISSLLWIILTFFTPQLFDFAYWSGFPLIILLLTRIWTGIGQAFHIPSMASMVSRHLTAADKGRYCPSRLNWLLVSRPFRLESFISVRCAAAYAAPNNVKFMAASEVSCLSCGTGFYILSYHGLFIVSQCCYLTLKLIWTKKIEVTLVLQYRCLEFP